MCGIQKKVFKKFFLNPTFFFPTPRNYIVNLSHTVSQHGWFTSLFEAGGIVLIQALSSAKKIRVGVRVGQKSRGLFENKL